MPSGILTEDRGASVPTILDILAHALNGFRSWVAYDYVDEVAKDPHIKESGWSLAGTTEFALKVDRVVEDFLASLSRKDLDREFTFHWTPDDASTRTTMKTRDLLRHLVVEELQHRGEINALLREREIDAPIMDWIDWVKNPDLSHCESVPFRR